MLETPTDKPPGRITPKPALSLRWNAAATRALALLEGAPMRRDLNAATRAAILSTLAAAPPLYLTLKERLHRAATSRLELDVTFADDDTIQQLNAHHRAKDKPTDVLSFPMWEGDFAFPDADWEDGENTVMLGDMVISVETAARQGRDLKHDLRAELAFLSIHGTLHLLGYDHDNGSARRRMWKTQDEIFERVRKEREF